AWQQGLAAARAEIAAIRREVDRRCPEWNSRAWLEWQARQLDAGALRFGRLTFDVRPFLGEAASGEAFASEGGEAPANSLEFALPALYGFPQVGSIFIKAQDAGRQRAVELLQVLMLRLLTTLPPGKVRFTIIDPAGLGQNFAAFMHLADFDEALVTHRIWTESHQIEQRLADLTEHMETVIQKYLRNEFATIEDYNQQAGEIAEPFRILVVANFPAGFSEVAARRLLSIAATGPRCGVYTLLSADARLPRPAGMGANDLAQYATVFTATNDRLAWLEPDFKHLPLAVDPPPPADWQKRILQAVGQAAVGAKRVEVPFEAIAPLRDRYWTADSRRGLDIPLGRVGATRLQHLKLGQGTAQHVLIAGKTGSGKSTLLHALIVNAALRYSPAELELYLIDFKKGVEFKTYVTHELPHARVVAIESEREFGLSVMQRLDAEMHDRGERFRAAGVQDIAGFRDAGNQLPRILFIVDEFQEFFVADDRTANEASLLLDRLVRQGRAFGIHVHLGSQTLGGAYSLARSTLGQMAVRIALQCSENDAHLILSEDNTAARLLSRPGEAIYNDANGLVEGNHPFQVVWLPDDRRDLFLADVQQLAEERPASVPRRPQIVFEGMQPAELERNEALYELVTAAAWPTSPRQPCAWLGEPLAIAEATTVSFARRDAANVLFIGQNDEAAAGMLTAALVSLAAQLAPSDPATGACVKFVILDGGPADGPQQAPLRALAQGLPHEVRVASAADGSAVVAELHAELERRRNTSGDAPPVFLVVYDLPRLRELRRQEEEFSFSRRGETDEPKPDRQFADLLRDGPALGMHALVWCDTLTNFNRMLERGLIKQFAVRVLLQMSAADSSLLVDTPAASQLGKRRALLHREEEGGLEKFRPYAPPDGEWLSAVGLALGGRQINDANSNGSTATVPAEVRGEIDPSLD
ncbi:MAG: FtsK/SpoIIIE domain-containing protein, partial [Pirellulales bacterium]